MLVKLPLVLAGDFASSIYFRITCSIYFHITCNVVKNTLKTDYYEFQNQCKNQFVNLYSCSSLLATKKIYAAQNMKFFIKNFFSKCTKSTGNCRTGHNYWKKSLMENFIFHAVICKAAHVNFLIWFVKI